MPVSRCAYRLSPKAEADLEEIWLYTFKNWSLEQADFYHEAIVDAFEDLASGRKTGRPVDIREGYRKLPVGAHTVYYRFSESGLVIIRILHQRMEVGRHI
ncbi:MAG: type II toxin-antitoxin system RelE/ParE family toxin [Alphaproteobacteria bacterium]|nr:type II toxin-antitoxin system RelE/ParE family toxin [Alphaproteobacteria bacterium]